MIKIKSTSFPLIFLSSFSLKKGGNSVKELLGLVCVLPKGNSPYILATLWLLLWGEKKREGWQFFFLPTVYQGFFFFMTAGTVTAGKCRKLYNNFPCWSLDYVLEWLSKVSFLPFLKLKQEFFTIVWSKKNLNISLTMETNFAKVITLTKQ